MIARFWSRLAPILAEIWSLLKRIMRLWLTYITGQFLIALLLGTATWLVNWAIGLSWALAVGLLAGILQMIPGLGLPSAVILTAVVALWKGSSVLPVDNWVFALIAVGICILIQQVSNLFIEPRITGKRLNLHPLIVLAAVIIGAALFNVVGAYLAVPAIVTAREIGLFIYQKVRHKGEQDNVHGDVRSG